MHRTVKVKTETKLYRRPAGRLGSFVVQTTTYTDADGSEMEVNVFTNDLHLFPNYDSISDID
jgi:hypothetical protein